MLPNPARTGGVPLPNDPALPPIPANESGPVFQKPWEAQAFSLVVALYDAGHFTWPEWIGAMSAEIRQAQAEGDPDLSHTYRRHWLTAHEKITIAKALAGKAELRL